MKMHVISFTQAGFSLSERMQTLFPDDEITLSFGGMAGEDSKIQKYSLKHKNISLAEWTKTHFQKGNCLVFIGAAGIAVREISPFVSKKTEDPAVLVIDEKGSFVIPILSGHIGGANEMARKIAGKLGATPVITTASDVNNLPAIDEFAAKNNLSINDMNLAKGFAAKMLQAICHYDRKTDRHFDLKTADFHSEPRSINRHSEPRRGEESFPKFSISVYIKNDILNLIPRCLILGVGCKKGKSVEELLSFVQETLKNYNIDERSLEKIASIDLKKDEKGILALSKKLSVPFVTFSAEELRQIPQKVSHSDFVEKSVGVDNVCERAVFASGAEELIVTKVSKNGMTLAVGSKKAVLRYCV